MSTYAKNDELITDCIKSGNYIVTEDGKVLSRFSPQGHLLPDNQTRQMNCSVDGDGYLRISYKGSKLSVARLAFYAFHRRLNPYKQINHIDGNRANNSKSNLEMISKEENMQHSYQVLKRPAVLGNRKISDADVIELRALRKAGWTFDALAERYGIAKSSVSNIVNFKTFKNLTA